MRAVQKCIEKMTPSHLLIIFGTSVMLTAVLCNPTVIDQNSELWKCRSKSRSVGEALRDCLEDDFSEEELKETSRLHNDTACVYCQHFCRKKDVVLKCMRQATEFLKVQSNKSRHMVPFVAEIVETGINRACDNDTIILEAFINEMTQNCIMHGWYYCRPRLEQVDDLDISVFCDYTDPESDPFTPQFICRKALDFLECVGNDAKTCSSDVQNAAARLASILRNTEICALHESSSARNTEESS